METVNCCASERPQLHLQQHCTNCVSDETARLSKSYVVLIKGNSCDAWQRFELKLRAATVADI